MWEEPEKDKGRDMAGQEGGGEVDQGKREGAKGKPRATDWEGSGRGTAAERIMERRMIKTVGCDGLGKFMGRMGEDIGRNERNCCDIVGGLFRQHRGIVATDREDSWEYRECIYYKIGEIVAVKGRVCCDT